MYDIINKNGLDFSQTCEFFFIVFGTAITENRQPNGTGQRLQFTRYQFKSEFLSRFPWFKFYLFAHQDGIFFFALTHSFPSCFFILRYSIAVHLITEHDPIANIRTRYLYNSNVSLTQRCFSLQPPVLFFFRLYFIYFKRNSQLDLSIKNKTKKKHNNDSNVNKEERR